MLYIIIIIIIIPYLSLKKSLVVLDQTRLL